MAFYKGRLGKILKNSVLVAQVSDWKIDSSQDILDSTSLQDTYKGKVTGLGDWKGSFNLFYDPANTEHAAFVTAALNGATLTDVKLYVNSTKYFSGSMIIVGMGVAVAVADLVKIAVTFEGDGALTLT